MCSASGGAALISVLRDLIERASPAQSGDVCKNEKEALAKFCQLYHNQRCFSHPQAQQQQTETQLFQQLLHLLKQHLITMDWWVDGAKLVVDQLGHTHAAMMALRLLLRDVNFQQLLMRGTDPLPALTQSLALLIELHFSPSQLQQQLGGQSVQGSTDLLKEITNIFQKVSNCVEYRERLVERGVHSLLLQLLWSHDLVPLQCSLCALINLCKTDSVSASVADLNCAPPLLHIISSYDTVSRHLASDLLLLLSQHSSLKDQIRDSDGLPQCFRILHGNDLHLLHRMVGVVERLLESSDYQEETRLLGGIPLLLGLLSKHVSDGSEVKGIREKLIALRAVCCSALTQLVLNDANAQLIVQGNGVYLIATNILPLSDTASTIATEVDSQLDSRLQENLQKYALRALRYLFSLERNRKVFKKLFPPNLFESFIDIGHYTRELSSYSQLTHTINTLPEGERAVMQANIEAINQNKSPIFSIGGYAVLELLGSGAFGSVYKVRKQNSNIFLALKEIRCSHPALGHTQDERSSSIGRLLNEVNIIREQLRHPNVVRYHKCFQEGDHVYIVMELLEGTSLSDHITALAEKGSRFSETRIWKIFLQLVLALRYLHKEKRVVHRDLSPANLMLSEEDKLTITDFGLAKQKQREISVMKSVVGTVLYWCPELVQSEPYNEKADVWAAGCILYLMATLKPPFHSTNLLALAKKIAEVDYESIPEQNYSPLVAQVVTQCLTADPQLRPDAVQLGSMLSGVMMTEMDSMALGNETLEKRLAKEKQKTVKHYHKAVWSERRYQQLLSTSNSASATCARRQLSSTFEAAAQSVAASTRMQLVQDSRQLELEATPTQSDFLQNSSDSVFRDNTVQDKLLGNLDSATQDRLLGNWEQPEPASPQIPLRGCGRPNPLISQTSRLHTRSSAGEIPSHYQASIPRKTSVPSHSSGSQRYSELWVGPLSPLAAGHKSRTPSASSTLSISPKHLREISDPILILLNQLHKLIFLTQLPPSPTPSARWTLVQLFKRSLFQQKSNGLQLKTELHKLVNGSVESVIGLGDEGLEGEGQPLASRMVQCALQELTDREGKVGYVAEETTLSYETLQQIIESLAVERGYYSQTTPTSHTLT